MLRHVARVNAHVLCLCVIMRHRVVIHNRMKFVLVKRPLAFKTLCLGLISLRFSYKAMHQIKPKVTHLYYKVVRFFIANSRNMCCYLTYYNHLSFSSVGPKRFTHLLAHSFCLFRHNINWLLELIFMMGHWCTHLWKLFMQFIMHCPIVLAP